MGRRSLDGVVLLAGALLASCAADGPRAGLSRAAVVGGRPATAGEVGATVALVSPADGWFFCTGTLVAPQVVLTAAHCVLEEREDGSFGGAIGPDTVAIVTGSTNVNVAGGEPHAVERVIPHPAFPANEESFEPLHDEQDIGLIVLAAPVAGVRPTPVLATGAVAEALAPGRPLEIAGYGMTSETDELAGVLNVGEIDVVRRSDTEILAGRSGTDSCFGDSGGPAYVTVGGEKRVAGVVSRGADPFGDGCTGDGVYTLAPAYLDLWLAETGVDLSAAVGEPAPPEPPAPPPAPAPAPGTDPPAPSPTPTPGTVPPARTPPPEAAPAPGGSGAHPTSSSSGCSATGPGEATPGLGTTLLLVAALALAVTRRRGRPRA